MTGDQADSTAYFAEVQSDGENWEEARIPLDSFTQRDGTTKPLNVALSEGDLSGVRFVFIPSGQVQIFALSSIDLM